MRSLVGSPPPGATRGLSVFLAFCCHAPVYASQQPLSMLVFDGDAWRLFTRVGGRGVLLSSSAKDAWTVSVPVGGGGYSFLASLSCFSNSLVAFSRLFSSFLAAFSRLFCASFAASSAAFRASSAASSSFRCSCCRLLAPALLVGDAGAVAVAGAVAGAVGDAEGEADGVSS